MQYLIHWPFPLPAFPGCRKVPGEVHLVSLCLWQELVLQRKYWLMQLLLPLQLPASSSAGTGFMYSDVPGWWVDNLLFDFWAPWPTIPEHGHAPLWFEEVEGHIRGPRGPYFEHPWCTGCVSIPLTLVWDYTLTLLLCCAVCDIRSRLLPSGAEKTPLICVLEGCRGERTSDKQVLLL